jgi:hypothetical protein
MSTEDTKALIARLRELRAKTPQGTWMTYSEEGPYQGTTRQTHSVCIYDPTFNHDEDHVCVTTGVGDDEEQARNVAIFIAEAHTALPRLLDELEAALAGK